VTIKSSGLEHVEESERAKAGLLKILKYSRDTAVSASQTLLRVLTAALNGHLHILEYARENGCPCDEDTY